MERQADEQQPDVEVGKPPSATTTTNKEEAKVAAPDSAELDDDDFFIGSGEESDGEEVVTGESVVMITDMVRDDEMESMDTTVLLFEVIICLSHIFSKSEPAWMPLLSMKPLGKIYKLSFRIMKPTVKTEER
jgi:hypothetical protein